jgi:hypothetical protein
VSDQTELANPLFPGPSALHIGGIKELAEAGLGTEPA